MLEKNIINMIKRMFDAGFSKDDISETLKISIPTVNKYVNDNYAPRYDSGYGRDHDLNEKDYKIFQDDVRNMYIKTCRENGFPMNAYLISD
ncbi:MAG: winged helix-turn-helix domain-containing protein [Candidatus Thermoplasmatota archaeon]|nr:winged helix-turn-helix domain-containing protein [Candidatus Thermoplasmatota archaeon]